MVHVLKTEKLGERDWRKAPFPLYGKEHDDET